MKASIRGKNGGAQPRFAFGVAELRYSVILQQPSC